MPDLLFYNFVMEQLIQRHCADKLYRLSQAFPVVTVTGPRQSGKTTLARMVFPEHEYISLENPEERDFAHTDPKGFLKRFRGKVILDEIQREPDLLSYIQGKVDEEKSAGQFILTGSQQFQLSHKISQTLAGRTAMITLLPFSLDELLGAPAPEPLAVDILPAPRLNTPLTCDDILLKGFYPPLHHRMPAPQDWLSAYYLNYVERDVRQVASIGDLETFQRFVRLCAGRTGQILNLSSLGADCGISHTTARHWISILQASYIIHLLPPHYTNFSKRLIKSPKLYFLDTGLLCYLLRIKSPEELPSHAMRGAIFETFVVSELYKAFTHRGELPPLFFWRDRTGHEVDILMDRGSNLLPIEVKSGETVSGGLFDGLKYFCRLGPPASERGVLIYGGQDLYLRENFLVRPWHKCV